jgi:trimeric autotransporter adhesin
MIARQQLRTYSLALVAGLGIVLGAGSVQAAPAAGTVIGNQAAATYTDGSSVTRTATSNTVTTVVQQVAALTIASTQSKTAGPGAPVSFAHTIRNTGNGSDSFNLTAANIAGNFNFTGLAIYADANCDGIADNMTPITSIGPVAAGANACVVVQGTVPGTALAGHFGNLTITAASQFTPATTAANTDTIEVTANAVINVSKSLSAASGNPGSGPYTFTLSYTNTGSNAATNVVLRDAVPSGMTYVAGSGRWSVSGATALTDAAAGDPSGVAYDYNITNVGSVTAVITSIAPNTSGNLTFQVNIGATQAPGVINNTAYVCYNDGVGQVPAGCTATLDGTPTNTVPFTVNQVAAVNMNGAPTDSTAVSDAAPVASATQGSTVSFSNYVWNRGNGTDSFDVTIAALGSGGNNFPAGTTFQLFRSDGVTPLLDTNGNGTPDTGNIPPASGGTCTVANGFVADTTNVRCGYRVVLRATLPPGASLGGPFNATLTAASRFNAAVSDTIVDTLTAITANTVDLRNGAANTLGTGAGPEGSPVTTNSVNPGASTTFTLKVNNTVGAADSYNLSASTDSTFATSVLPGGWTVTFRADGGSGDCSSTGATLSNTGVVNASGVATICAVVSVPANAAASPSPGTSLYFLALSPTSGASDRKHDAVIVNTVRAVTISPNNIGQIFPGGSAVYTHTVTNNGNVVEGDAVGEVTLAATMAGATSGWNYVVYWDRNNDGVLDAGDPVITDLAQLTGGTSGASTAAGLDIGESARILVRVFAPGGAAIGDVNIISLTATVTGAINGTAAPAPISVTDGTTVIAGQVRLIKEQAIDANCDGTPDGAYSQVQIVSGAVPGACIRYRITATNEGTASVSTLVLSDSTPANTRYHDGTAGCTGTLNTPPAAATTVGTTALTSGACGASATFQMSIGTLLPSQSAVVTFGVRIDP